MEISTSFQASYECNIAELPVCFEKIEILQSCCIIMRFLNRFLNNFFYKFVFGIKNFNIKQASHFQNNCVEGLYCVSVPDSDTVPE